LLGSALPAVYKSPGMRLAILKPLAAAAFCLLLLGAVRGELLMPDMLDFGRSLNAPTPEYARFLALWMLFATLAAGALAVAIVRTVGAFGLERRFADAWNAASDRKWLFYGGIFAFLIPAALRTFLLQGAPLTDDESAYRFMAQVLASGRMVAESPPLKLFFDNRFMINDGKLYAHFFIGWPALLVPGVLLGIPGLMNAVYSALTVPALYGVLKRLTGRAWARAGIVLYLGSPMLMVAAATETAHTSCVAALAWFTWCYLRGREEDAPWWIHGALALSFSVAFFIRPTSALGVGLPLLAAWAVTALRRRRLRSLLAFALPAVAMAGLFFAVNKAQTGSFLEVAYQRAYSYAAENDFRFSLWDEVTAGESFSELRFGDTGRSLAITGAAVFRLGVTFMGWPCSILFALFAGSGPHRRLLWLSVASYFAFHFFTDNVGIDTFAPMHYFEVAWPLLLLNVLGLARLTAGAAELDRDRDSAWRWRTAPAALAAALMTVSAISYLPVRFGVIHDLSAAVAMPREALRELGIERAVIFTPEPFIYYCKRPPARGWVFVRPNNDPDLGNDILWVNHLSVEKDKLLMRHFPDRPGFIVGWDPSCRPVFVPLDRIAPGTIPDAEVSGIEEVGLNSGDV
ncbi:MAG: glycosyltransferase family 39 protein, partial [Thermoanaerobaculia bacterium]